MFLVKKLNKNTKYEAKNLPFWKVRIKIKLLRIYVYLCRNLQPGVVKLQFFAFELSKSTYDAAIKRYLFVIVVNTMIVSV